MHQSQTVNVHVPSHVTFLLSRRKNTHYAQMTKKLSDQNDAPERLNVMCSVSFTSSHCKMCKNIHQQTGSSMISLENNNNNKHLQKYALHGPGQYLRRSWSRRRWTWRGPHSPAPLPGTQVQNCHWRRLHHTSDCGARACVCVFVYVCVCSKLKICVTGCVCTRWDWDVCVSVSVFKVKNLVLCVCVYVCVYVRARTRMWYGCVGLCACAR